MVMQEAYNVVIFKFMPDDGLGTLIAANIHCENKYNEKSSD